MGCGKSHWGAVWAKAAGYTFIELDAAIEAAAGMSVNKIFVQEGEAGFRQREREHLHKSGQPNTIVATGGGTPCFFDNIDWMNATGHTIYLQATPALLAQRLQPEKAHRPLLHNISDNALQDFITQKLSERETYYVQAHTIADAATLSADSILPFVINQ